jgi:hypothetical protein
MIGLMKFARLIAVLPFPARDELSVDGARPLNKQNEKNPTLHLLVLLLIFQKRIPKP